MAKSKVPTYVRIVASQVSLTNVGGWDAAGSVVCTYQTDLEDGVLEVISPRHLYHRFAGRDLYPTKEQVAALLAGEQVVLGTKQWA
jgi:hypothetical protein